jgi:hypothetical protein
MGSIDSYFLAFNISFVPREENSMADSLAVSASNFRIPLPPKLRYDIEVKCKPSITDNFKIWKVFEDDHEIKRFLENIDEFSTLQVDQDLDAEINPHDDAFVKIANHHIL